MMLSKAKEEYWKEERSQIAFAKDESLRCQEYKLVVDKEQITIRHTSDQGAFYGLVLLWQNMMLNIDCAVEAAGKYGAEGILLTDWGDNCHMQYLPVSYGAILYCGALSWNRETGANEMWLAEALDTFVFRDENRQMGRAVLEAGKYYLLEEQQFPCRTLAATIYTEGIRNIQEYSRAQSFMDQVLRILTPPEVSRAYLGESFAMDRMNIQDVLAYCGQVQKNLAKADMQCRDAALIAEEIANGVSIVEGLSLYRAAFLADGKEKEELKRQADKLLLDAAEKHKKLWRARNKESGLETGLNKLLFFTEGEGML